MDSETFSNPEEAAATIQRAREILLQDPSYAAVIANAAHKVLSRRTPSERIITSGRVRSSDRPKEQ